MRRTGQKQGRGWRWEVRVAALVMSMGMVMGCAGMWVVSCVWPVGIIYSRPGVRYEVMVERSVVVVTRLEDGRFRAEGLAWGFTGAARGWHRVQWWEKGRPWWMVYWLPETRVHGLGVEVMTGQFATPMMWHMRRVWGEVVQVPWWVLCVATGAYPARRVCGWWRRRGERRRGFPVEVGAEGGSGNACILVRDGERRR